MKNTKPRIITNNDSLRTHYHELAAGDIFLGRLRLKPSEEHILLDLVERNIRIFPSALSQLTCRSKTMQALLFSNLMLPHTSAVHDQHELRQAMNDYHQKKITRVVTKQDRSNAGMGIHLWSSVEDVYNQAFFKTLPFPFVLQPYYDGCRDIRVIVLGDYQESYWRDNPDNFRNNLHFGGKSTGCELTVEQKELCRQVMKRGKFPYGHIDLMVTPEGESFISEINLRGGIKGAQINPQEYRKRVDTIHQEWLHALSLQ